MLRSIQQAYEIVCKEDPDTALTTYTIRKWCKEGKIRHLMSGNKILVDMDSLYKFINEK